MPGIIHKFDGWKPKDRPIERDLRKEQRDNLRRLIGEALWEMLDKMTEWYDQEMGSKIGQKH